MSDQAPDDQAREFATAFRGFLDWVHATAGREDNEVSALVRDFLGPDGTQHSVVTRELPVFEHVNLQTAVDAWSARAGRTVEVRGIALPPHYGGLSLQQLVAGEALPPLRLTAPALADLPNGPESTLGCLRLAVLLVTDQNGRHVVMIQAPSEHQPSLQVEVAGLPVDLAQRLLAELDQLRADLNVYRGHLLDVSLDPMAGVVLAFAAPPGVTRDDVVLPVTVLARVERHALGVASHREALLATGQHLKRGLLLYGPPGTGKTHTTRYLLGQMTGYTRLVLTGRSLVAVGAVTDLARGLLPAVVVLEDVDLVAEERSLGPASSPVLFDLLDAMDGAAPDADLLFLLTTNRADLLEPALAARPGRVDVAVEIGVPDAPAREQLLTLYARHNAARYPSWLTHAPYACTAFSSKFQPRQCAYYDSCQAHNNATPIVPELGPMSHSGAELFALCPEKYRLNSVLGADEGAADTAIGSAFHAGIAEAYRQLQALQTKRA